MTDVNRLGELCAAYNTVLHEARHLMAWHRRLAMMLSAAVSDADKLQAAIDKALQLEQECANEGRIAEAVADVRKAIGNSEDEA